MPTGPRVSLLPAFRPTVSTAVTRLPGKEKIVVSARSSLLLDGDIVMETLYLDGALAIRAAKGATVVVRRLHVQNAGYVRKELSPEQLASCDTPEVLRLRGYQYVPDTVSAASDTAAVRELYFDTPGAYVVDEGPAESEQATPTVVSVS